MSSNNLLQENVTIFAQSVRQSIMDMVGIETTVVDDSVEETLFQPSHEMTVMIHFTGPIQGEYGVAVDEKLVAAMIGCYSEGMPHEELIAMREDYGGFLKEALNASVGAAIENLSKEFDDLTFLPPVVIYGKIDYPLVPAGKIKIEGDGGGLECFFVLNMMGLELGEKLQQTLKELQITAKENAQAKRNIQGMLEAFPAGMVVVSREGIAQPGYSKLTSKVVGLEPNEDIGGMYIPELLGFAEIRDVQNGFKPWLEMVWGKIDLLGIKTIRELCPILNAVNSRGVFLELEWFPSWGENNQLEALMLIIEDVTEKKRVEEEMRRLNETHERNMELVTQVLNLEADEVTEFLYDSTGLLKRAKGTIKTATRDRKFIEELYRTVHTLKGNSGQYQFKGLQKLAADIENDLALLRIANEGAGADIESYDFSTIDANLEEANSYLQRLEEMQTKLGGKDESLAEKAERAKPGVLVPFEAMQDALDSIASLQSLVEKDERKVLKELVAASGQKIAEMREVPVSNFKTILSGAIHRTADKLNKHVVFDVHGDVTIDIEIFRTLHQGFVHLINNALDHGIEEPGEREANGKIATGCIQLSWKAKNDSVVFELSDDGRGIDFETVLNKYNKNHQDKVDDPKSAVLINALFESGFSTREIVSDYSGRGVGLDAVKHLVDSLQGTIEVESEKGQGTLFRFNIPIEKMKPSLKWRK